MRQMKLEEFETMAQGSNSYVLNIDKFNLSVRFFAKEITLEARDEDFFARRTKAWETQGDGFGSEPFYGADGQVSGIVTYGLIS